MEIKIISTEASKLRTAFNGQIYTKSVTSLQLKKRELMFGRGEIFLEDNKEEEIECVNLNQKSISRKHASLQIPGILSEEQKVREKVVIHSGKWKIPSYYFKFHQRWLKLTAELLSLIRQFSEPSKCIIVKDLKSKFGVFCKINNIVLHKETESRHQRMKVNEIIDKKRAQESQSQQSEQNEQKQNIKFYMHGDMKTSFNSNMLFKPSNRENQTFPINLQLGSESNLRLLGLKKVKGKKALEKLKKDIEQQYKGSDKNLEPSNVQIIGENNKFLKSEEDQLSLLLGELISEQNKNNRKIVFVSVISESAKESSFEYYIGRHKQCDVQINKSEISRKQMLIRFSKEHWEIIDLNSTNGCWLRCFKAVFPIKNFNLVENQIEFDDESQLDSIQERFSRKQQMRIQLKLGELRVQIQIKNYTHYLSNMESELKSLCLKTESSYEKILEGISLQESPSIREEKNQSNEILNRRISEFEGENDVQKEKKTIFQKKGKQCQSASFMLGNILTEL